MSKSIKFWRNIDGNVRFSNQIDVQPLSCPAFYSRYWLVAEQRERTRFQRPRAASDLCVGVGRAIWKRRMSMVGEKSITLPLTFPLWLCSRYVVECISPSIISNPPWCHHYFHHYHCCPPPAYHHQRHLICKSRYRNNYTYICWPPLPPSHPQFATPLFLMYSPRWTVHLLQLVCVGTE